MSKESFIPSATAVVAYVATVGPQKGFNAFYAFEEDTPNYIIDMLTDCNYDPYHDPYAQFRSIASEYNGTLPAAAIRLINFAQQTGIQITFLPSR